MVRLRNDVHYRWSGLTLSWKRLLQGAVALRVGRDVWNHLLVVVILEGACSEEDSPSGVLPSGHLQMLPSDSD